MPARPLIWPLLAQLNPQTAYQRYPKSQGNLPLVRVPALPWDVSSRPGFVGYGNVEGDPSLAEFRALNLGLAALGRQSVRLQEFKTNPRAHSLSEQQRVPAAIHFLPLSQFLPPAPPPNDSRQTSRIIWPLMARLFFNPNRIASGSGDNTNLRAVVPGFIALQQTPKAALQRASPLLPWARISVNPDMFGLSARPAVVHVNPPSRVITITGVTKDGITGAIVGGCVVELYDAATNLPMMQTISDATTGVYQFNCAKLPPGQHQLVFYKPGSPDKAGATMNTIVGV